MSWDFEDTSYPVARRDHPCDGCEMIRALHSISDLSESSQVIMTLAKKDNYKILKGQRYLKIKGRWEGEFTTYRCRIDVDELCIEENLYD